MNTNCKHGTKITGRCAYCGEYPYDTPMNTIMNETLDERNQRAICEDNTRKIAEREGVESDALRNKTQTVKREPEYTLEDVGCYVDSARGIHSSDQIYSIAIQHSFKPAFGECFGGKRKLSDYEFSNEIEDEIDDYMNDKFAVDGAYWGRSEQGDWGLWAIEED